MLVLGIESSCDETAAAVVRDGVDVLSNVVASQHELHRRHRGVVPELASRSHLTEIVPVVTRALELAAVRPEQLDGVAVTHRPGLIGCLLVGLGAAKTLAWWHDLPLTGVDHVAAHVHASFMTDPALPLPCLALVASGGHTALYLVTAPGRTERVGTTRDDAAGEALDKGAALLGLPYPGGPAIERAARSGDPRALRLPRPRLGPDALDFSFSGIKTALLYALRGNALERPMPALTERQVADLAASYQAAIVDSLVDRLARAVARFGARSFSIGGGVARNESLRDGLRRHALLGSVTAVFPGPELCSDNAAMVAGLGTLQLRQQQIADLALPALATARSRG
jgi:N6-L-threonylcarbamoyladenine synthase